MNTTRSTGTLVTCLAALLLGACGPSYSGQGVKTPEERVAEQEQLEYESEQEKKARGDDDLATLDEQEDEDAPGEFDEKQSKMELKRATRSAKSCPGVVTDEKQRGEATVTITFSGDGAVKDASITPPFDGTRLGECILNAYKAVIVPPFKGDAHVMDWQLTIEDVKAEDTAPPKK